VIGFVLVFCLVLIPSVIAPVWYGTSNSSTEANLVGHWAFEGDARDLSGNGNDGTITGAKVTRGVKGRGMEFDGVDDVVDFSSISLKNYTLSAWVNIDNDDNNMILGQSGANPYLSIRVNGIGHKQSNNDAVTYFDTFNQNQWYHIVLVVDGSNRSFYIDGVHKQTNTSLVITTDTYSKIGNYYTDVTLPFGGSIDEVRIYNTSLSAGEIAELYNSSKSYHLSLKTHPVNGLVDETGLVGYWKMNSATDNSTHALDSSGEGNHGEIDGAVRTNEGRFNEGYEFDGVDDYVDLGNRADLSFDNTSDFSLSFWIKSPYYTSGSSCPISKGYNYYCWMTSNNYEFRMYDGSTSPTVYANVDLGNVFDNVWHHITITADWTNNENKGYVDGVQVDSYNLSSLGNCSVSTTGYIGRYGSYHFNGTIDEVRIYNRSLSATEVAGLYNGTKSNHLSLYSNPTEGINNESGLVGHWKMNAGTDNSTHALDSSGEGNHGEIDGAVRTNEGRFKEGYRFNNTDKIEVPYDDSLNLSSGFSVSTWFYADDASVSRDLVYRGSGSNFNNNYQIYYGGYDMYFRVGNCSDSTYSVDVNVLESNKWYHAVGVYNTSDVLIYLDGILVGTKSWVGGTPCGKSNPLTIGRRNNAGSGITDEVRIYNRSLSATEIAGLYNGTKSKHLVFYSVPG